MKGHYPKAYLRMDPNIDMHPDFAGMVLLICAANRQPQRGRFQPAVVTRLLGRKRTLAFLAARPGKKMPDLVEQADGTLYLDGWDEWQEGDLTVGERVRRLRAKRGASVTPPLQERFSPSEALGVRRKALDSRQESPNGAAGRAGGGRSNGGPPAPPASGASRWLLDHDPTSPLEAAVASKVAHLASLTAEREGEADATEILAAVSATPAGATLDHIRGAPTSWLEHTVRACDAFEADNFSGEQPHEENR